MPDPANNTKSLLPSPDEPRGIRLRRWRTAKDFLFRHSMAIGGIGVIIAILLIFFYLFYVVLPLFVPASAKEVVSYRVAGDAAEKTLFLAIEEYGEVGVRITTRGQIVFFNARDGKPILTEALTLNEGVTISSVAKGKLDNEIVGLGLSNGTVIVAAFVYDVTYPNDVRAIAPRVEYPFGKEPLMVNDEAAPIAKLGIAIADDELTVATATKDRAAILASYTKTTSLLSEDEFTIDRTLTLIPNVPDVVDIILLGPDARRLYLASYTGEVSFFDVSNKADPRLIEHVRLVEPGARLTSLQFLSGGNSLLVGQADGQILQWFPVRDKANRYSLRHVRDFSSQTGVIIDIAAEPRRKGFWAIDDKGQLGIYHATAHRTLLVEKIAPQALTHFAISPRAVFALMEDVSGKMHLWHVTNEHPEVSWSSLWGKVWYENYQQPEFLWQSSAATNDFEPKFSLTPLSFGTLKAAFFAMLIAAPLSILGAIFTAQFMAPRLRTYVKPTVEIMEALPTVILGFLAGLWLAPFLEMNMPGMIGLLVVMPIGVLLSAFLWSRLPGRVKLWIPDGLEPVLLAGPILLLGWGSIAIGPYVEQMFFGGDMRIWLTHTAGIDFDQRNALVVGFAMGFAIIPNIFSIAEDAIFGVPKHLTNGSLALGATAWQTLTRVVLPTASPGIFSGVMIGLGRAVGETMIVLMATGNTPVMDFNVFEGMRTLSANIAVEMPESEVNSTHYRVLFLAALVLFAFTFFFNTIAEVVRQRLRKKYSSL